MKQFRDAAIWLQVQWDCFKANQSGAQTLEWLALALLIVGLLAAGSSAANNNEIATALKEKIKAMINKLQ